MRCIMDAVAVEVDTDVVVEFEPYPTLIDSMVATHSAIACASALVIVIHLSSSARVEGFVVVVG